MTQAQKTDEDEVVNSPAEVLSDGDCTKVIGGFPRFVVRMNHDSQERL